MIRIERDTGALTLVSRLARPRALAVIAVVLGVAAAWVAGSSPRLAAALGAGAVLVPLLGGRSFRARFDLPGRGVTVRPALPLQPRVTRRAAEFASVRIETVAQARAHRAEALAERYRETSGGDMPMWLRGSTAPGTNDHLRRIVLVPRSGDPFPVTAWLAEVDDLEPALRELQLLLG